MNRMWIAIVGLAAGTAVAQVEPTAESFEALDEDKDGRISVVEAEVNMDVLRGFAEADRDQDGFLSREEFAVVTSPEE